MSATQPNPSFVVPSATCGTREPLPLPISLTRSGTGNRYAPELCQADGLDARRMSHPDRLRGANVAEPWLFADDIAAHLEVAKDAIYTWIAEKAMPANKLARLWRFQASEIDDWGDEVALPSTPGPPRRVERFGHFEPTLTPYRWHSCSTRSTWRRRRGESRTA